MTVYEPTYRVELGSNDPARVYAFAAHLAKNISPVPQQSVALFMWDRNGPDVRHTIAGFSNLEDADRTLIANGFGGAGVAPLSGDCHVVYDGRGRDAARLRALAESEEWDLLSEPGRFKVLLEEEYDAALAEAKEQGLVQFGIRPEHEGRSEIILHLGPKISKLQREAELKRREAEKQSEALDEPAPSKVM